MGGVAVLLVGGGGTVASGGSASGLTVPVAWEGVAMIGAGAIAVKSALGNMFKVSISKSDSGNTNSLEGESETGNWNKGSFDSPEDSLDYHYRKHGDEVGATSRDQYLRKAEEFAKTVKKGSTKSRVDGAVEGTIRYKKNGKYIDIAPDGSIVSFGKQ